MSNIKAIDELRRVVGLGKAHYYPTSNAYYDAIDECVGAIEREVSGRYIELPVDMDGVPIHYGDSLSYCGEHGGTVTCKVSNMEYRERSYGEADWLVNAAGWVFPGDTAHVKPRTLEDVLKELANEVWEASCTCQTTWSDSGLDGIEERYADEIREVLGASE